MNVCVWNECGREFHGSFAELNPFVPFCTIKYVSTKLLGDKSLRAKPSNVHIPQNLLHSTMCLVDYNRQLTYVACVPDMFMDIFLSSKISGEP